MNEMKHKFGNDLRVDFELVDDIPREKSGKHKLMVNMVEKQPVSHAHFDGHQTVIV